MYIKDIFYSFLATIKKEKNCDNLNISEENHSEDIENVNIFKDVENEFEKHDYEIEDERMAQDLMKLIGKAIDQWAEQYEMNDLPKHIVFKQALGIMQAWDRPIDKE